MTQTSSWRAWRESLPKLSMRSVAGAVNISPWRLSLIERGVAPTDEEAAKLRAYLIKATAAQDGLGR